MDHLIIDAATTVVAGDWHGDTDLAVSAIEHAHSRYGARTILHVGDFGYTFTPCFTRTLTRALAQRGMMLAFIRGNHDSTTVLHALPLMSDGLYRLSERILHIEDGTRLRVTSDDGREWLLLAAGGAGSIDRALRETGVSWWPDERISERDVQRAITGGPIDILLAHDVPAGATAPGENPQVLRSFERIDPGVGAWCSWQREQLEKIVHATGPSLIVHGHWHEHAMTRHRRGALTVGLDREGASGNMHPLNGLLHLAGDDTLAESVITNRRR